jgi:hypothetical protein
MNGSVVLVRAAVLSVAPSAPFPAPLHCDVWCTARLPFVAPETSISFLKRFFAFSIQKGARAWCLGVPSRVRTAAW